MALKCWRADILLLIIETTTSLPHRRELWLLKLGGLAGQAASSGAVCPVQHLEHRLPAPCFVNMNFELLGCYLICELVLFFFPPKESHCKPLLQLLVSQSVFLLKRSDNGREFLTCQAGCLALQSSNLGNCPELYLQLCSISH